MPKDGKGRRPDWAAAIFGRIEQQTCAVWGVRLFAAGIFPGGPDRRHAPPEGLVRLPQIMEQAGQFCLLVSLEVSSR
jgi:hypothetical protein